MWMHRGFTRTRRPWCLGQLLATVTLTVLITAGSSRAVDCPCWPGPEAIAVADLVVEVLNPRRRGNTYALHFLECDRDPVQGGAEPVANLRAEVVEVTSGSEVVGRLELVMQSGNRNTSELNAFNQTEELSRRCEHGFMTGEQTQRCTRAVVRFCRERTIEYVASVRASAFQGANVPQNTLDQDLGTRWSAEGDGQWIEYDLDSTQTVNAVRIAWYRGDERQADFDLEVSLDASTWTEVFSGSSSGTTLGLEGYDFDDVSARYVRIVGHGNTQNEWTSITEVEIIGRLH